MRGMTETLSIGERVAWYRRRRGMSQEVLAGLVGRTADWLGKVENGRIYLDRLSVIKAALTRRRRPATSRACGLAAGPGRGGRLDVEAALVALGLPGRRWTCWRAPLVRPSCAPYKRESVVTSVCGRLTSRPERSHASRVCLACAGSRLPAFSL